MKNHAPARGLTLLLACTVTPVVFGQAAANPGPATQATADANPADADLNNASSPPVDSRGVASHVRSSDYEARDKIASVVEAGIQASREAVAAARSRAGELRAEAREQYQAAIETFRQRDAQVRDSLRAARRASRDQYEEAREKLARDYEAFVIAAADVQANGEVKITRH
jgi:hypothetical protein